MSESKRMMAATGEDVALLDVFRAHAAKLRAAGELDRCAGIFGTELTHACGNALVDRVDILLELGADPNVCDTYGQSPLIYCVNVQGKYTGQSGIMAMQSLLDAGADIHHRDKNGNQAASYAMWLQGTEVLAWLISKGADPMAVDRDGRTLLHDAVWAGRLDCAKLLIECGADVLAKMRPKGKSKYKTALELARKQAESGKNMELADYLKQAEHAISERLAIQEVALCSVGESLSCAPRRAL